MNDIKIVIDAGHGGADSGAIGNGLQEKDYTLLIAKYLKNRFDELGVKSILIRDTDETLSPQERVNKILNAFGNTSDVLLLSNHLNAGGGEGSEVIYALRNNDTLSNMILDNLGKEGLKMRKVYQRRLPSDNTKDYYFIHRNTGNIEPVLIEYAFIDNKNDAEKIKNNYKRYAEAVVKAVSEYKNIPYTTSNTKDTYTVVRGDTLWNISKRLNIPIDEIKRLNNLDSNLLYVGQVLKLPNYETTTDTNITYIVQKGDTLYSIATKNDISVSDLKKYNNLTSDNLSIGQELNIPKGISIITPSEDEVINEGSVYEVKKGDTLYSISKKFNTTIDKIKELNSIVGDILTIGTNLLIPTTSLSDIIIHKVVSGDSLWSLANKYNTTINSIKKLNNLVSDLINVGDELQVKRNTI